MDQDIVDNSKIDDIMTEYLKQDESCGKCEDSNDFIINFDISYSNGKTENHICGCESEVFGGKECNECQDNNEVIEEYMNNLTKNNMSEIHGDDNCRVYAQDYEYICDDFENYEQKWDNCEEELNSKKYNKYYSKNKDKNKDKNDVKGRIIIYSTLECVEGTRIKGVKINLYRINGVSPQLVSTCKTDCDGKAEFINIPEGNYRVIQLIDKRYFNKPSYVSWNEVSIDCNNRESVIYAVNTVNNSCFRRNR